MATPCVNIFWNKEEGIYLIQQQAPAPEGAGAVGGLISIGADEFDQKIGDLVLRSLDEYSKKTVDSKTQVSATDKEWRHFARRHTLVSVAKLPSGELLVSACERRGAAYGGVKDGVLRLDIGSAKVQLINALRLAFSKTT